MDTRHGNGWSADVVRWQDRNGTWYHGSPLPEDLPHAYRLVVRYLYSDGTERHTTIYSGDDPEHSFGWDEGEFDVDIVEYEQGSPTAE